MTLFGYAISSVLVSACFLIAAHISRASRYWPGLWASAIVLSAAMPALLALQAMFGVVLPDFGKETFHGIMDPIIWDNSSGLIQPADSGAAGPSWLLIMAVIYSAGLILSLTRLGLGRFAAARIAARAKPCQNLNGHPYWLTDAAITPFAMTSVFLRGQTRIVIPARLHAQLSGAELDLILRHETRHIETRDDAVGVALRYVKAIIWFNPLVFVLLQRWDQACEFRCDAHIIQGADKDVRRTYAQTLLKALQTGTPRYPVATFSTPRIRTEKMRLTHIMNSSTTLLRPLRDKAVMLGAAVALSLGAGFMLTGPVAAGPAIEYVENHALSYIVQGRISSTYGPAKDPFNAGKTRDHHGVDIAAATGTPIHAPSSGTVIYAGDAYNGHPNYGKVVVLKTAGGVETLFSHLDSYDVAVGDIVARGQKIAAVGSSGKSTGPHLHIETRKDGKRQDPMDIWSIN